MATRTPRRGCIRSCEARRGGWHSARQYHPGADLCLLGGEGEHCTENFGWKASIPRRTPPAERAEPSYLRGRTPMRSDLADDAMEFRPWFLLTQEHVCLLVFSRAFG
jgi:hypothetical protein